MIKVGYFLVLMTIYLALQDNLMYANLSGISTQPQFHLWVVCHIIICTFYYTTHTLYLFQMIQRKGKKESFLIFITAIIMIIASLCPYTIQGQDIFSKIHVYCSIIGSLSFLCIIKYFLFLLSSSHYEIYQKYHWIYDFSLQFLAIMFIVFGRVNSYLEIIYAIIMTLFPIYITQKIKATLEQKSSDQ